MQVQDLYYKKYLKYKNKYLNLLKQIGGGPSDGPSVLPTFTLRLPTSSQPSTVPVIPFTIQNKQFTNDEFLRLLSSLNITNLQNLTLNQIDITEDRVKQLANVLVSCSQLRTLNLSNNPLNNNGATTIANILNKLLMLTTLDLSICGIKNDGGKAIANALLTNTSLTTLNIEFNPISEDVFIAFAKVLESNQIITHLNISNSHSISDNTYSQLANALRQNSTLQTLNIQRKDSANYRHLFKDFSNRVLM
jgi:Ran GTPase-activating protein (RanGAP) involved in mRNA processing and transport